MRQAVLTQPMPVTMYRYPDEPGDGGEPGDRKGRPYICDRQVGGELDRCIDTEVQVLFPMLQLRLLGDFGLIWGNTLIRVIDFPRLQSLLAYLVLHRDAPQERSRLAYLLWPDSTDGQAHTNLRNLVFKLRRILPEADVFLFGDRHVLQWRGDASWGLDVLDFERAIARADGAEREEDYTTLRQALERAMELYRGELLPSCYDEWVLPERDRLSQLFMGVMERLLRLREQEGDYARAIHVARRILREDPLREAVYRHLMDLYGASGNRIAAVKVYQTCAKVLERELGVRPSAATRALYERIEVRDARMPIAGHQRVAV